MHKGAKDWIEVICYTISMMLLSSQINIQICSLKVNPSHKTDMAVPLVYCEVTCDLFQICRHLKTINVICEYKYAIHTHLLLHMPPFDTGPEGSILGIA